MFGLPELLFDGCIISRLNTQDPGALPTPIQQRPVRKLTGCSKSHASLQSFDSLNVLRRTPQPIELAAPSFESF
jgi:hypothetical protein